MRRITIGILPAAGQGRRFGAAKQFLELDGLPLLVHAARALERAPSIDAWVVAVPPGDEERVESLIRRHGLKKALRVVAGGGERSDSVRLALAAAPAEAELAVIHDAARPFASPELFERVIEAAREEGAAIAALPCTDTVKEAEAGRVLRTLDRNRIWLAQTPQAFRIEWLRQAYERPGASLHTDEASLLEAAGREVRLVEGERGNFKVTEREDWERAEAASRMAGKGESASSEAEAGTAPFRVGMGTDVHAFEEGRPCILGGLEFPGEVGLAGHSDADVVLHALMDALLGAAGLGDIGLHFPDSRADLRGADSSRLLAEVMEKIGEAGYTVGNADLTLLAERPRIGPRREEMRARIASLLGVAPAQVNLKASTTEKLGFVGRGEGVACQAVVLLHRRR